MRASGMPTSRAPSGILRGGAQRPAERHEAEEDEQREAEQGGHRDHQQMVGGDRRAGERRDPAGEWGRQRVRFAAPAGHHGDAALEHEAEA